MLAERLWLALPFTHSEKLHDQQVTMYVTFSCHQHVPLQNVANRMYQIVAIRLYLQHMLLQHAVLTLNASAHSPQQELPLQC